jgi:hypothetical protein
MMMRYMLCALMVLVSYDLSFGATRWVSTTGTAAWSSCVGETDPGTYCSLSTANPNLVAGETVYLKAGTYNNDGYINPTNSGTAGNYITYQSSGGAATITGQTYGVYLNGKSYIKVSGITVTSPTSVPLYITNSNYNWIADSIFSGGSVGSGYWGSQIVNNSSYNCVSGCTFHTFGSTDQGGVFAIGTEESTSDTTQYNLIENCTMYAGGHHVIAILGRYNTIRNNHFHNEAWDPYGHRVIYLMGTTSSSYGIRNIIEGNRVGYAGISYDGGVNHGQLNAGNYNIVRFNSYLSNTGAGIGFDCGASYPVAPSYNAVYNNTFYNNSAAGDMDGGGVDFNDWGNPGSITGNLFKNNLFYANGSPVLSFRNYGGVTFANQAFTNNFNGTNGQNTNPLLVSTAGTDPTSTTAPNLALQAGSPAINYGTYLTTTNGAGSNSTTLAVTDAKYFQDGKYGPPGAVSADWVAVGTVSNTVQISFIDYSTNTITLVSPTSWSNAQGVWLYKKSDEKVVLVGDAPDAGAYEYGSQMDPPTNLRILSTAP